MIFFVYLFASILILIAVLIFFYLAGDFIAHFMGAPFVPTSQKEVEEILDSAELKKGQLFIELGSGDGRVVNYAVEKYQVRGLGIEVHPMLVLYSRFVAFVKRIKNVQFRVENFYETDLSKAQVVFAYLFPKTMYKLRDKFLKECKNNTLIISHGFKIEGFEKFLRFKINRELYPTYFYQIKK